MAIKGIKVTRGRVRNTLKSIDPLDGLRKFPAGLVRRRPYSVAGPNSLWHIGKSNARLKVLLCNFLKYKV